MTRTLCIGVGSMGATGGGGGVWPPWQRIKWVPGPLPCEAIIKIYIIAHATTYTYINLKSKTSLISSNDNTSKSGTDFEKERSVS